MPDLPFSKLFPQINPLDKTKLPESIISKFDLPRHLKTPLENHYGFILEKKYITAEKIKSSIEFLNENCSGENLFQKITFLLNQYDLPLDKKAKNLHFRETYFFWIYEFSAFFLLNEYLNKRDEDIMYDIIQLFNRAGTYKDAWKEAEPKINSARNTTAKKLEKKEFIFLLWEKINSKPTDDLEMYKILKTNYKESGGIKRFGKFYKEYSFTRNGKDNILTQFDNRQKTGKYKH